MAIDVDGGVLWLGPGRGVRVGGSGDFGRFVVFLALLRALAGLSGLQAGYKSSSKSKDSTRIDLRPQMWQLTSMAVCCGLVSFVACVLLVVAISAVSWFSWRSGVLQRPAGWLSGVQ